MRSKVTVKVLNYYFLNQDAQVYINELARLLSLDLKNTETKLKELEKEGILTSEFRGKQRYYYLAKRNPVMEHYRQIFLKTHGVEKKLRDLLSGLRVWSPLFCSGRMPVTLWMLQAISIYWS
jgi:DNA-binding transcriptional ArsR family regulator